MNKKVKEKIQESLVTVLPVTAVVLLLSISLLPMDVEITALFLVGACFLIVGMGFFQLGAEISMMPLGQGMGSHLVKQKRVGLTLAVCFFVGMLITMAEPDLKVLSEQVPSIPGDVLVWAVAAGVGLFTAAAVLRILLKVNLRTMLRWLYPLLFMLSFFAPGDFTAVAFDSGGVTTGPMTVPFIMALGIGFSSTRCDKEGESDSFGLISLCSVGPIMMVLLLGICYTPQEAAYELVELPELKTLQDVVRQFMIALPVYMKEVAIMVLPLLAVFAALQLATRQYQKRQVLQILVGFLYTFIGTSLFLTGVNVGFSPVGTLLGEQLASSRFRFLLIPVGMLVGYFIVKAEPAVQVLNRQVEEITNGTISKATMNACLSAGVACAVGLAMVRILTGISIYWILIPGYLAALIMTKFVPDIFVGIAFDSGGVASGPMTSTFLLPMAIGACLGVGGNITTDAFGVIALVALAPIVAIEITGVIYQLKYSNRTETGKSEVQSDGDEIIEWEG